VKPYGPELAVNRVVALPALVGADIRGLPVTADGFLAVDESGAVGGVDGVYAVGDITDFPVKFGGVAAQQADTAAAAIAALAGATVTPDTAEPKIQGILFTGDGPRYLTAQLSGRSVSMSRFSERPPAELKQKIFAKYLAPYLDQLERPERSERPGRTTVPS
jgi:NADH dehydrogenase FAD-containing subunit